MHSDWLRYLSWVSILSIFPEYLSWVSISWVSILRIFSWEQYFRILIIFLKFYRKHVFSVTIELQKHEICKNSKLHWKHSRSYFVLQRTIAQKFNPLGEPTRQKASTWEFPSRLTELSRYAATGIPAKRAGPVAM